ncbi:glycosyltransferase [Pseudonocardia sp. TRM90224]|uniref:glycosyltransferase n=1 Tax=Pseudonocardia sp. TRM90224 TaxID=2812678 RepID=UPI001E2DAC68|nr:glycosyltransferase [Pseudonocardia sp. TRM90224]
MTATMEASAVAPSRTPLIEVVVPIRNEASVLDTNVRRLHAYLQANLRYDFLITIAESASTDGSREIGEVLSAELPGVRVVTLVELGRGLALRHAWASSSADVVAYMDADLSVDLDGFLPLVASLVSGHSDLAIGTRHARGSSVHRSLLRSCLSRTYNFLLRVLLGARFSDAQCGFKAGRREVVHTLLPVVRDDRWFFDTELLCVAERHGMRIHEVPIDCLDDPNSSVEISRTVAEMLRGIVGLAVRNARGTATVPIPPHLRRTRQPLAAPHRFLRSVAIGVGTALLYGALFLVLLGVLPAVGVNVVALVVAGCVVGHVIALAAVRFVRRRRGLAQIHGAVPAPRTADGR